MEKDDLTSSVVGCALKVYNTLGNRFPKIIYQRSLAIELRNAGINFELECVQTVYYEGYEVGTRRVDFVLEHHLVIELITIASLTDEDFIQAKNDVIAYDYPEGVIINFGASTFEYKKISNPYFEPSHQLNVD